MIEITQVEATAELQSETLEIETNDCGRASAFSRFVSGLLSQWRYVFFIASTTVRCLNGHSLYLDLLPEAPARLRKFSLVILGI